MIGERLARIRREAALSLREFRDRLEESADLSISYSTVRNYERSDSVPSEYLVAVVESFGVDPGWLLMGGVRTRAEYRRVEILEALRDIRRRLDDLEAEGGAERPS